MISREDLKTAVSNRTASRDELGHYIAVKRADADLIAGDVAAFLAKGGQIRQIPHGEVTISFDCVRSEKRPKSPTERVYKYSATVRSQIGSWRSTL